LINLVLKNVGKIEKFIVEALTQFLDDFVVFPNYHTILFDPTDALEMSKPQ
jgi:hypothetical protein